MGEQGVGEPVPAPVAERVGSRRRPQQRESQGVAPDVVAVLAVVEEGDPVAGLRQVGPSLGADLEAGLLEGGVGVGGPGLVAELDLEPGRGAWTPTGKATLRNLWSSCQSTSVTKSTRREPASSTIVWSIDRGPELAAEPDRAPQAPGGGDLDHHRAAQAPPARSVT